MIGFALLALLPDARLASRQALETHSHGKRMDVTVANDEPGFAILVKRKATVVSETFQGVRQLRDKPKIDARTNFRLASCSKQFTAMAVMLLVHDGKLRYDDSLSGIFPEFPAYGNAITVRHLLNHTSGLPDYEDLMDAAEKQRGPLWSPEHQIQDSEVLQLLEKEQK